MDKEAATRVVRGVFDEWYPTLVRYAWRASRSMEQAEDAAQTAFLEYFRALQAGQAIAHPKAWLLAVAKRELQKTYARLGREAASAGELDWLAAVAAPPAHEAFDQDRMLGLLSVLTPREEEVVLLRLDSLKYREIAEQLGVTVPTVNTLMARAVEKLRSAMELGLGSGKRVKEGHAARRDR